MTDVITSFPNRPLKLHRTGIWPGVLSYLGGLLLLAVAAFIGITEVPGIIRDIQISRDPVIADSGEVTDGECSTRNAFFVDCSAEVAYDVKGKRNQTHVEMMFIDFHDGDYSADVVYSRSSPRLATLSLGLDMLWNRIIFAVVLLALVSVGGIALLAKGWSSDRARWLARRAAVRVPVTVQLTSISKHLGAKQVGFTLQQPGKKRAVAHASRFRNTETPFMLDQTSNAALALVPEGGGVPVLLDDGLERVDLTASERMTLLALRNKSAFTAARTA